MQELEPKTHLCLLFKCDSFFFFSGACGNELNHCETTKGNKILSGTQLKVKQQDFSSACNITISNFFGAKMTGIKSCEGKGIRRRNTKIWALRYQERKRNTQYNSMM